MMVAERVSAVLWRRRHRTSKSSARASLERREVSRAARCGLILFLTLCSGAAHAIAIHRIEAPDRDIFKFHVLVGKFRDYLATKLGSSPWERRENIIVFNPSPSIKCAAEFNYIINKIYTVDYFSRANVNTRTAYNISYISAIYKFDFIRNFFRELNNGKICHDARCGRLSAIFGEP